MQYELVEASDHETQLNAGLVKEAIKQRSSKTSLTSLTGAKSLTSITRMTAIREESRTLHEPSELKVWLLGIRPKPQFLV
jgi:hypothetical protein